MNFNYKINESQSKEFNYFDYSYYIGKSEGGFLKDKNGHTIPGAFNYQAKNIYSGALGKYQFMPGTLSGLRDLYNLPDWKNENYFLNYPDLQETYHLYFVQDNLSNYNASDLYQYLGRFLSAKQVGLYGSANINIYGILAGYHLTGPKNIKKFFHNNIDKSDGQTYISDYVVKFSKLVSDSPSPIIAEVQPVKNAPGGIVLVLLASLIKG